MAKYLADEYHAHGYRPGDRRQRLKTAKRAIARLEHWGLVRSFKAAHEEADMVLGDYLEEARARARRQGRKDSMLTVAFVRQL